MSAQNDKMIAAMMDSPNMEIEATTVKIKKNTRPALTAYVNGDAGKVEKDWMKRLEDECQCSFKKSKGFYEAVGVRLPSISVETVSLFTRVEEDEEGARMDVIVDFGGKFLSDSDSPEEAAKMRSFMGQHMREFYCGLVCRRVG